MRSGRLEEAYGCFESACALAREIGDRQCEAANTGNLGLSAMSFGRLGDALKHMRRDHELAREIRDVRGEAISLGNVGWALWFVGATDEAMEWTRRQLELAREIGGQYAECYALSELAGMTEESDPVRARELYEEALALRRSIGFQQGVAETLVVMGRFLVEQGDEAAAIACLDESIALAREIHLPSTLMFALAYRARLPGGDAEAARAALESQGPDARYIERMEARHVLWQVTGERAHLDEAHRLLMGMRENTPPEYRETMMQNVPLHRDIVEAHDEPQKRRSAEGTDL
jgi:tetratricopeptide (TPR) repeat protein